MMWMHLLPHHHHHHQQHHECGSNQWKVREKGGRAGKRKGNRACKSFLSWPSFAHFWHVWDNRVRLSNIWNVNELDISFSNFSREYFVHGQYYSGLSKVDSCWRKSPPTWLVWARYSAWHFIYGWRFLKYPWTGCLLWQLSHLLENFLTTLANPFRVYKGGR